MEKDKNGIPFIDTDVAAEVLEHSYGIVPSDDDCHHELLKEVLSRKEISFYGAIDLIQRLMPMICHGESQLTGEKYKGFGKIKTIGDQPQHMEMIGKVTEDFWFIENEKGKFEKGVFKKSQKKS